MLTVGSLFAGIGGFDLGLERAGMRSLWQCEIDPYCQRVLAKHWPDVLRVPDVRDVRVDTVPAVDVICGGFPCQDLSWAGPGAGIGGARSGLWSEYARVVGELRPRYVVVENVAALLARGMGVVLGDLAAVGYDAEWDCVPASAVGAPHQRDRVWIVAYPHEDDGGPGRQGRSAASGPGEPVAVRALQDSHADATRRSLVQEHDGGSHELGGRASRGHADGLRDEVANAYEGGRSRRAGEFRSSGRGESADGRGEPAGAWPTNQWWVEPDVGRVAHGVPNRVDRIAALGNALVPQIAEWIGRRIVAYEEGVSA